MICPYCDNGKISTNNRISLCTDCKGTGLIDSTRNHLKAVKTLYNSLDGLQMANLLKVNLVRFNNGKSHGIIPLLQVACDCEKYSTAQAWIKRTKGMNKIPIFEFTLFLNYFEISIDELK